MQIVPIFFKEACEFIAKFHRHHKAPIGRVFQLAVSDGEKIIGVAIVGRPVCVKHQDGFTLEVTRLCTDGTKNACSMLYGACTRVAKHLGYRRLQTYILSTEPGTSLKAAGWECLGDRRGYTWNSKKRPRVDKHPIINKTLYIAHNIAS